MLSPILWFLPPPRAHIHLLKPPPCPGPLFWTLMWEGLPVAHSQSLSLIFRTRHLQEAPATERHRTLLVDSYGRHYQERKKNLEPHG